MRISDWSSDVCSSDLFVVAYSIYDEWYHFDSTLLLIIFPIYSTMWNCIPLFLTTKTEGWHADRLRRQTNGKRPDRRGGTTMTLMTETEAAVRVLEKVGGDCSFGVHGEAEMGRA